ncbi:MAG: prepilin-type N-terminal cleavage/methylation domain-containing protein [Pseudomonadota bacterium]
MMIAYKAESEGFTLIEVMVSMTIIAIVMVSLFRMQSGAIDLAGADRFQNITVFLAKKKLAQIEPVFGEKTEETGRFEEPNSDYQWSYMVTDVDFQESRIVLNKDSGQFKKIEVEIREHQGSRAYHVTTFRYVAGK